MSVSFATQISPLFRDVPDVANMLWKFNLKSYTDVYKYADMILLRLNDATNPMPCDGQWPPAQIALFAQWIADGKQP